MNLTKIKELVESTYGDTLEPGEERASDIYKLFPNTAPGTVKYRLQGLVRTGKMKSRRLASGELVYKLSEVE